LIRFSLSGNRRVLPLVPDPAKRDNQVWISGKISVGGFCVRGSQACAAMIPVWTG